MNFELYMKQEIEKAVFIEINKDISFKTNKVSTIPAGEYPLLPSDVVALAQNGMDNIPGRALFDGMLYMIACDIKLKHNKTYIELLKNIDEIKSYIISKIQENEKTDTKKAVVYVTALTIIYEDEQYLYNRVQLLMELYEKTNQEFIKNEILRSLEELIKLYPNFKLPYYHLGEYYLNTDKARARIYLSECKDDKTCGDDAEYLLYRLNEVDNYDKAVDYLKKGEFMNALKILVPFCEDNPENLDAKFYTAVAYRQADNYPKAMLYLKELLPYGETIELCNELGVNLAALSDFQGAYDYFKKALKMKPDNSDIICNMGACKLNLGDVDEAKKAFQLALRLNPKDEAAKMWIKYVEENYTNI